METLLVLLALIGHTAVLNTDLGTCEGLVIAPGVAEMHGTCTLTPGSAVYFVDAAGDDVSEEAAELVSARTLESGRVVVTFKDGGAL